MSQILCTFPGRNGDILWSLPTARAIAEAHGAEGQVDFQIAGEFAGLAPVLQLAPFLREVYYNADWHLTPPEEWHAPSLVGIDSDARRADRPVPYGYDQIVHLGYRAWPDQPLPEFVYAQTRREYPDLPMAPLDLDRPWLVPSAVHQRRRLVACCISEEWIELKFGVLLAVVQALESLDLDFTLITPSPIGRHKEWEDAWLGFADTGILSCDFLAAVREIASAAVVLTCNSAPWVAANALGKPVVMLEPSEARRNPIFWLERPRNRWVLGGDGKPTVDARATAALLHEVWEATNRG